MYTFGIDIGSTTTKCVILKDGKEIVAKVLVNAGTGTKASKEAFAKTLLEAGLSKADLSYIVATGYGRSTFQSMAAGGEVGVGAAGSTSAAVSGAGADAVGSHTDVPTAEMSELSCHGKGVFFTAPDCRTIIDIGGQDAKVISLSDRGTISGFVMNDKCAAGTGRFLDVMAGVLMIGVEELEAYARRSTNALSISSTCTVFAESEVISQLSKNADKNNLVAGICNSVASRVASLAKRQGVREKVYMSGGVAQNGGVRDALSREIGTEVHYTPDAQFMGALGAAIVGYEKCVKTSSKV